MEAVMQGHEMQKTYTQLRPFIVGPELFELNTAAHLFSTRVFVNGRELEILNYCRETSTYLGGSWDEIHGEVSPINKIFLNAHLQPGENEIKVTFNCPFFEQAQKMSAEELFLIDAEARVVLNTGQLNYENWGADSSSLGENIDSKEPNVDILLDKHFTEFTVESINDEITVVHKLFVAPEKSVQVATDACEIEVVPDSVYKGELLLNDQAIYEFSDFHTGKTLSDIKDLLVSGENTLSVNVKELWNDEPTFAGLIFSSSLKFALAESFLDSEHKYLEFGNARVGKNIEHSLANIDIDKTGKHTISFYYDTKWHSE